MTDKQEQAQKYEPLSDEDGDPFPPYTQEELDMMRQNHEPHEWERGRWLATIRDLQGHNEQLQERILTLNDEVLAYVERVVLVMGISKEDWIDDLRKG